MRSRIILLNGASSSGKSTLARALQARIEAPFWHVSIDHLRDSGVLPMDRFRSGEFQWGRCRKKIFDGFHASLAAYAGAGNNLIVEHILDEGGWAADLIGKLRPHDVFFAGVHCGLRELQAREAARGGRPIGSAARDFEMVHAGRCYDLELDGTAPVSQNVTELLSVWRSGRRRSEFAAAPV
ncbi:chloramphenicol phosphotransferase CPT family protein [Cribrihabitans neustonicus]|uniref:chloramphenicol phosphotransferase CPT family protein n=1 Tax=Cribrihabitans neustonicus TaxID=1429085 RepID=UPI003B5C3107